MSEYKPVRAIDSAYKEAFAGVPAKVMEKTPEIEYLVRQAFYKGAKFGNDFTVALLVLPDAIRRQMQNDFDQELKDLEKRALDELPAILESALKRMASTPHKP